MLYRFTWTGTYDVLGADSSVECREAFSGEFIADLPNDERAQAAAEFGSDEFCDVDFISPGGRFSASNPAVLGGTVEVAETPDWVFYGATITSIERAEFARIDLTKGA